MYKMPARIGEGNFKNPERKSLDQLIFHVKEGNGKCPVPALHKRWATKKKFANYSSLVCAGGRVKADAELEEWQYEAESFREDMKYLLRCRHHEFWSLMVYEKAALGAVVSFLQRATPFYLDVWPHITAPPSTAELYEQILCLVLRVICRLITNRESDKAWITKEHHRDLIYKNFLISVPMMFDLLIAVGDSDKQNASVLRKVFETLLEIEPSYKADLLAALAFFRTAFRSIQTQTENEGFEGAGGGAPDESTETPYDDVVLYTLDCAYSLGVLLEVCPAVRELCGKIKLAQSITQFYDSTIPFLYKNIFLVNENAKSLNWLNQARLQFLRTFRNIAYQFVESVLAKPEDSLSHSEHFVGLLTECLSDQLFVVDYQREYPVELDMEILKQACTDLDDFKANFVVQGYQKESESAAPGTIGNIALTVKEQEHQQRKPNTYEISTANVSQTAASSTGKKEPQANSLVRDIDLEVTAVLDVLPHLGTGFVRRVLSRYDNSEDAIAAILEENLPPDLVEANQAEVYIPPDPQDKLYEQTGLKHFNVHDGDAYDVMTQDNPNCIIKQGKGFPNAPQNAAQLLDDKSDLETIRHRYQQYSLVAEGNDENDEYEDEYDDSYEAVLESETRTVKSKQLRTILANVQELSEAESEEEDGSEEEKSGKTDDRGKRMNFCENPEVIRARYEAKRQAKWGNRSGGGGGNGQNKTVDVVGAPKGQGQEKDTLRNRDKKEKHKSSRANHNRKAGAAFKRGKGMMS